MFQNGPFDSAANEAASAFHDLLCKTELLTRESTVLRGVVRYLITSSILARKAKPRDVADYREAVLAFVGEIFDEQVEWSRVARAAARGEQT